MGDLMVNQNMDKTFTLGIDAASEFLPKILQFFVQKDTYLNESPIWESPRALIIRKDLDRQIKGHFDYNIILASEFGLIKRAFRAFPFDEFIGMTS